MIFDLLTSPQGHQFDPRMKILLTFYSARHPNRFGMPHDHVWNKYFFWPPGNPQHLKVPPLGHDPGDRIKIPSDMFCICHLWEHTKFGTKIFEIDFVIMWSYKKFGPVVQEMSLATDKDRSPSRLWWAKTRFSRKISKMSKVHENIK